MLQLGFYRKLWDLRVLLLSLIRTPSFNPTQHWVSGIKVSAFKELIVQTTDVL